MPPANREFLDLLSNIKLYLFQEYSPQSWIGVSRESYMEYRVFAVKLNDYGKSTKPPSPQNIPKEIIPPSIKPKTQDSITKAPTSQPLSAEEAKTEFKNQKIENPITVAPRQQKDDGTHKNLPDFSDFKKIVQQHIPHLVMLPSPPEDSLAKKIKSEKKETTLFFYVKSLEGEQSLFLNNLCKAVKIVFGIKADVINNPISFSERQCLLELPNVEIYIREPKQKATLWKTIESLLQQLPN